MQAFIIQSVAVLFGLLLAYVNSVPVNMMIMRGAKLWESREFHNANYLLKLAIASVICAFTSGFTFIGLTDFILIGLWLWLSFDIILNLFIHHEWDYIGTTSKIDDWLTKRFKKRAGQIKAFVCIVGITGLNILRNYL